MEIRNKRTRKGIGASFRFHFSSFNYASVAVHNFHEFHITIVTNNITQKKNIQEIKIYRGDNCGGYWSCWKAPVQPLNIPTYHLHQSERKSSVNGWRLSSCCQKKMSKLINFLIYLMTTVFLLVCTILNTFCFLLTSSSSLLM